MKIILIGKAQEKAEAIGLLTEEMIINPIVANEKLSLHKLKIEKIEMVNGEKVVTISENNSNLLLG